MCTRRFPVSQSDSNTPHFGEPWRHPTVFKMGMVFYGQTFQASESNTVIIPSSQQGQGLFWKPILMIVTPSVPKKNKASLTTYTGNIEFQHSGLSECSATSWWETKRPFGKSKTPIAKVFWEAHSYYICCSCNFASLLDFLWKKKTYTQNHNHCQSSTNLPITKSRPASPERMTPFCVPLLPEQLCCERIMTFTGYQQLLCQASIRESTMVALRSLLLSYLFQYLYMYMYYTVITYINNIR